ncbi:RNase LS family HEPN domain-containing protein [Pelistega suis]|nr:RNase LS family HEPN domain-containing protein [Pelistega suis]
MVKAYGFAYKTHIEISEIDGIIGSLNLPVNYPNAAVTLLKQAALSLRTLEKSSNSEFDYTHYVHPAYRALEGHIKFLFEQMGYHIDELSVGGNHFDKDKGTSVFFLKTKKLKEHGLAARLTSGYNLYCANRHKASHFGEILGEIDTTLLIESPEDAKHRIKEVFEEIKF